MSNTSPTFSVGDGQIATPWSTGAARGLDLAVQADGKVVVVGSVVDGGDTEFAIARYNTDGSLDKTFSEDGLLTVAVGSRDDVARRVRIDSDGKIVVVGTTTNASGLLDTALVRVTTTGTLDSTFSGDGIYTASLSANNDAGTDFVRDSNGRYLVTGWAQTSASAALNFGAHQVNSDGTAYNTLYFSPSTTPDYAVAITRAPDNKIVIAGFTMASPYSVAVARLHPSTVLDSSFSLDGLKAHRVGTLIDKAYSVAVQADLKIVVVGTSQSSSTQSAALVLRYTANGELDPTFSGDGYTTFSLNNGLNEAREVLVQPNGGILVGCHVDGRLTLVRLLPNGQFDSNFGDRGSLQTGLSTVTGTQGVGGVALDSAGRILVTGSLTTDGSTQVVLARYSANGVADATLDTRNTLPGEASYTEDGAAVRLAPAALVRDAELTALAGGLGDYGGATLQLARQGGANAADVFVGTESLGLGALTHGQPLLLDGAAVGTVSQQAGLLRLTFAAGTTQAQVNRVLQAVAYRCTADAPEASVTLEWNFSDGNAGAQGYGAALTAVGTTTVRITAANDAPQAQDSSAPMNEDGRLVLRAGHFGFADPDGGTALDGVRITSLPAAGALTLDGAAVAVDAFVSAAQLAAGALVYTPAPDAWGTAYARIGFKVGDGLAESAASATLTVNVTAVLDNLDLSGTTGNDTLSGDRVDAGSHDRLRGLAGHDSLSGGAGNDTLEGGDGNDTLHGGSGADVMEGGNGRDVFYVDHAGDRATDTGTDGQPDAVTVTSALTAAYVLGSGIEHATLGSTAGHGSLTGNGGANQLAGNAGHNTLDGGAGADTLLGGAGNDTYRVDHLSDRVFETTATTSTTDAGGTDLVISTVSFSLDSTAGTRFVEHLRLDGAAAIDGTGNALGNTVYASTGNNVLDGLGGSDWLSYLNATGGVSITLASTAAQVTGASGTDTVRNFENLAGGQFNDNLRGATGANVINGNGGDDKLTGNLGNDTLTGGAGADTFRFDSALNATTNVDRITDYNAAADTLQLENSVFTRLATPGVLAAANFVANTTGRAMDADDYIVYDSDSGLLYYDADGSGAGAAVLFATVTAGLPLTAAEFVVT